MLNLVVRKRVSGWGLTLGTCFIVEAIAAREGNNDLTVNEEILELFAKLGRTGSLEAAVHDSLRLVCAATGSRGAVLRGDSRSISEAGTWSEYDPDGIARERTLREVAIPLRSSRHCVGYLTLLAPTDDDTKTIEERIAPLDSVLATIMAATMAEISMVEGLLNGPGFRTRVDSEIARAQRYQGELSILHIRFSPGERPSKRPTERGWGGTMAVGKAMAPRLRDSDSVGLIAPDHLAILFPATDRLGARIALKRVELLLADVDTTGPGEMAFDLGIKSFPEDGSDTDELCSDSGAGGATDKTTPQRVMS